jgi:hypothetical protein
MRVFFPKIFACRTRAGAENPAFFHRKIMPRGAVLTPNEQFYIATRYAANASVATIARELKRKRAGVEKFITVIRRNLAKRDPGEPRTAAPGLPAPRPATKRRENASVVARRDRVLALTKVTVLRCCGTRNARIQVVGREFPSASSIRRRLADDGVAVSKTTVLRDCAARGIRCRVRAKVADNSDERNANRVELARAMLRTNLRGYIFCDETWCNTNDNTCRTELVPPGETATPRQFMKHPKCKLMVWAAIGVGYKSELVIFPRDEERDSISVNADAYEAHCLPHIRRALDEPAPRRGNQRQKTFVQDNARPHLRAGRILESEGFTVAKWPPYSPHLNPIERLWALLHQKIAEKRPQTDAHLTRVARQVWNSIDQETIDQYVLAFPGWLRKCVRLKGEPW